ncbi:hypothetical protein ACHAXT_012017 [Thalassiosira profunda]
MSSAGAEGCRCIDTTETLASLPDRACTTSDGNDGVLLGIAGVDPCVDYDYGASACLPHDLGVDANCVESNMNGNATMPQFCNRSWCYVNRTQCRATEERVYRSQMFPAESGVDMFFSYSTCGSSPADWFESTHYALGGVAMTAIAPNYNILPWVYTRDYDGTIPAVPGEEYYDANVPPEGVHINFVNALQKMSDEDFTVSYVPGSRASAKVHPSSPGNAAVQDVVDGIADIAIGPIWITGGRLKKVTFTMPIHHDRTVLVIPKPGSANSLSAETQKVLDPFTYGVWGLLIATIAVAALLATWFSGKGAKLTQRRGQRRASGRVKKRVLARLYIDEFLQNGTFFCSAGIEQKEGASLPHRLLMFGFAFFILILVSAYVANLAAFLTRSKSSYVGTIEESIALGYKICAHPALQSDLELAHPNANFIFNQEGRELYGLLEDYDAGLCEVMAVGKMDSLGDLNLMALFCDRKLVYTDSLVIENPVGFPIRSDLASGFSYWIYQGEKYSDVTVETLEEAYNLEYNREPRCNVLLSEQDAEEDEFAQIGVENCKSKAVYLAPTIRSKMHLTSVVTAVIFPTMFFVGCAVVAIILQLYHERMMKTHRRGSGSLVGRSSTLNLYAGMSHNPLHSRDKKYDDKEDEEEGFPDPTPQQLQSMKSVLSRAERRIENGQSPEETLEIQPPRRSTGSSLATGVVTSSAVELDRFGEKNGDADSTAKEKDSLGDPQCNADDMALSRLDSGVMDKLDELLHTYQSMKRRKKLMSTK